MFLEKFTNLSLIIHILFNNYQFIMYVTSKILIFYNKYLPKNIASKYTSNVFFYALIFLYFPHAIFFILPSSSNNLTVLQICDLKIVSLKKLYTSFIEKISLVFM